ncbi:MAG: accessory factor UbiK family protein [Gammaproteobacteria bacterium]|nr:accessory factor UbiK family protein [Gammaproteobacteria bacterium]
MKHKNFFENLTESICNAIPTNLPLLKSDIEKNIKSVLTSAFSKLDLVTREEFDTQTKVLARTRKKIEKLEEKIAELEKLVNETPDE